MNANIASSLHITDTLDGPPLQTDSLDPEIQTYFFVNRNNPPHDSNSACVSPRFSNSRAQSYEGTPRLGTSGKSVKSGESKRSNRAKTGSLGSSPDWHLTGASYSPPSSSQGTNNNSVDPPRPPKAGFEWVWFPEGYWAERERHDISPSKEGSKPRWWRRKSKVVGQTDTNRTHVNFEVPKIKIGSIMSRRASSLCRRKSESDFQKSNKVFSSIHLVDSTIPPSFHYGPLEGLYCKAKRSIKEQLSPKPKTVKPLHLAKVMVG
jgi:hypothetical protein